MCECLEEHIDPEDAEDIATWTLFGKFRAKCSNCGESINVIEALLAMEGGDVQ